MPATVLTIDTISFEVDRASVECANATSKSCIKGRSVSDLGGVRTRKCSGPKGAGSGIDKNRVLRSQDSEGHRRTHGAY